MKGIWVFALLALASTCYIDDGRRGTEPDSNGVFPLDFELVVARNCAYQLCCTVDCSGYPRAGNGKITTCPTNVSPVCGSNDQTYNNECLLCSYVSNSGLDVKKLHNGSCIDCNRPVEICTMERRPHCGSDGRTYGNQCDFCDAIQKSHGALYLVKYGVC